MLKSFMGGLYLHRPPIKDKYLVVSLNVNGFSVFLSNTIIFEYFTILNILKKNKNLK